MQRLAAWDVVHRRSGRLGSEDLSSTRTRLAGCLFAGPSLDPAKQTWVRMETGLQTGKKKFSSSRAGCRQAGRMVNRCRAAS